MVLDEGRHCVMYCTSGRNVARDGTVMYVLRTVPCAHFLYSTAQMQEYVSWFRPTVLYRACWLLCGLFRYFIQYLTFVLKRILLSIHKRGIWYDADKILPPSHGASHLRRCILYGVYMINSEGRPTMNHSRDHLRRSHAAVVPWK